MRNIARAGRLQVILDKIDLSSRRQLFDLGGGPGAYSIAFCKKFPQLKAILFDLPETIAIAKEVITEAGMQELIALQSGSWDADEFGSDTDVFLASNVMHGPSNQADMKLAKAYRSMTSGALLLIQEFLLNDDKTGPLIPALFNIMVGAFSRSELFAVIEQAGFVNPRIIAESEDCSATWIAAEKP
jgi:ubiquinone/menaquinone biosynthesis C-methylase UbiE